MLPAPAPRAALRRRLRDSEKPAPKKAAAAPKANGKGAAAAAKKADSDSDSDGSESDSEVVEGGAAKEDDSSNSDSSDDEEAEAPKANGKAAAADSDDSDDSDDSSDSDEEEKPKAVESKKRKAEAEPAHATKKNKTDAVDESAPTGNLFVGNISWNVDEEWLTREFEEFGELAGVRIITDRDSGRSKGFGYVEFSDPQNAKKALEAKNGAELDGRELRLDFSTPRTNDGPGAGNKSNDRAARFGDTTNAPAATLFVGNISFDADENAITEYFQEHGTIKAVRLPTDRETGAPKGFGYVEMSSIEEAQAAFTALQGADIAGRPIRLDYAAERSNDGGDRGGRGGRGGGRGGFDRGGRGGGRGGFGDRGGRGGGRGFGGGRGRGGDRGGRGRPQTTNRGGFGDFSGQKISF
ncbi:unnamed protein product [Zymoseptoria tritici ST99CH_3D7]|uniref:RRM domain-containing protein n=1 Tax=Zymoseptoria tritici (strain ST99CH_3D7) TaxID=1276538 RepID=A0A1X7REZ7_ZYMT9|nr:unnamed protein product [Zymoseptoria tritici ST99CH_3D7]